MSRQPVPASTPEAAEARRALVLTRSISVTWWYVASSVGFFELIVVLFAVATLVEARSGGVVALAAVGVSGLLWWLATLHPLLEYRHRTADAPLLVWRHHLAPFVAAAAFGLAAGLTTGVWAAGVLPLVQVLMLLNWPPGVRFRVVLTATALLVALAVIDFRSGLGENSASGVQLVVFSTLMPAVTVSSLWWWDVLVALDRARASEAKLAATQERLRLATDVHDLQGHHLQVIALQLELAERLMPRDPEAGMEQLRAARASVDDARQGTRDLATRFRSVPLRDELANAVDLLRAAGTRAEATVAPDASLAPAPVLGPVVRETTTNVLRHGGGRWARLSLTRTDGSWRYEISNDVAADTPDLPGSAGGAGLDGIARRAAEVDGDLEVRRDGETFTVVVTVPADDRPADDNPAGTTPTEERTAG